MIQPIYDLRDTQLSDSGGGGGTLSYIDRSTSYEKPEPVLEPVYLPKTIQPVYQAPEKPIYQEPVTVFPDQPQPEPQPEPMQTVTSADPKMTKSVRILDEFGNPIPGAHVYFDQNTGTTTNFNGEATISSVNPNKTVYISFVGYEPKAFSLQALPSSVALTPGEMLSEVVVDAPAKAAATDSKVPKYLFPAIGGLALLLILMSMGKAKPKKVTL